VLEFGSGTSEHWNTIYIGIGSMGSFVRLLSGLTARKGDGPLATRCSVGKVHSRHLVESNSLLHHNMKYGEWRQAVAQSRGRTFCSIQVLILTQIEGIAVFCLIDRIRGGITLHDSKYSEYQSPEFYSFSSIATFRCFKFSCQLQSPRVSASAKTYPPDW
jgi:hypothetical protein